MVTVSTSEAKPASAEPIVTLRGVSWQTYKSLMADVGDDRAWRIAYDRGNLEIRMPLLKHEEPKRLIESFVEAIADELGIEIRSLGALTLEREELSRALEPDSCFYIQNELQVRGKDEINLPGDPPPDLVVESDYTSSSLNKFSISTSLGIPELWRYHKQILQVYQLLEGKYQLSNCSLAFPFLPIAEIPSFIEQNKTSGQRSAVRLFKTRIQAILENLSKP